MIKSILLIALGSGFGGVLRYLVARFMPVYVSGTFPWATFSVNVLGCFLIGLFYALTDRYICLSADTKLFLTVGLCGGFTTFSTFINENFQLSRTDLPLMFLYIGGSLVLGFIFLWLGQSVVKLF